MVLIELHLRRRNLDWSEIWKFLCAYLHLDLWNLDTAKYVYSALVWHH